MVRCRLSVLLTVGCGLLVLLLCRWMALSQYHPVSCVRDAFTNDAFTKTAFTKNAITKNALTKKTLTKDALLKNAFTNDSLTKDTFSRQVGAALDEFPDLLTELYQRSRHVQHVCGQRQRGEGWTTKDIGGATSKGGGATSREGGATSKGGVVGVFVDGPSRVAYCYVPKVGCTFWIRVFSFLHNLTGHSPAVRSPLDLPRLKVHSSSGAHGQGWKGEVKASAQQYLRFMFVRHPYSRLWSAYLDKLFLPDFWNYKGIEIVKTIRAGRQRNVSGSAEQALDQALRCGNDVSFQEFVEYALTTYEAHWSPIFHSCDPCQFRPAVVGKMETFDRDSRFLLRRMGMGWVMDGLDRVDQSRKELLTLVDYNFDRVRSKDYLRRCVNDTGLAGLLWRTFQMNGYIPADVPYHPPPDSQFSQADFKAHVVSTFNASLAVRDRLRQQKKDLFHHAIQSLPPDLMQRVRDKYRLDMLYFNYTDHNY